MNPLTVSRQVQQETNVIGSTNGLVIQPKRLVIQPERLGLVGTVVVSVGLLGLFPSFSRVSGRCIYKPLLEENSPYTTSCTLSIPGVFLWYPPFSAG